jgi:predicted lipid-binding transport protein (Tim44 family)
MMADTRKTSPKQKPATTGKQGRRGPPPATKNRPGVRDAKGKLVKGAAARRLEAKRRRQRALTWTAVVVVAALVIVGVIVWQGRDSDRVSPQDLAAARQQAGSSGVTEYAEAGRVHIEPSQQPANWNSNPPTSGDHLASTISAGVYDSQQDERAIVHNLEHGYVVIQYRGIPEDQVNQLRQFVQDRSGAKLILAPYSSLERDGVALTAWRNVETMQRVNLDVVKAFVDDYMVPGGAKSRAPEPFAP